MSPLFWYAGIFAPATVLIPIVCALSNYRDIDQAQKLALLYLLVAGCTNVAAAMLAFSNRNNLFLLHLYTAVEFALLSAYFMLLIKQHYFRFVALPLVAFFFLFCLYNAFNLQTVTRFNSYPRSAEAVLLPTYGLYYLYTNIGNHQTKRRNRPHYWMVIGIIIYFTSSLIQFSFSNIFTVSLSKDVRLWLWTFHTSMVIIMYIFFAKAYLSYPDER